jgi:exopolyphosphatase/guanosine-5'-triphosphate,3'-diphosphate pyrophosphatase
MRVCAIDIGTNSVRAIVADVDQSRQVHVVHREGSITRLGQMLKKTGALGEYPIQRTAEAVREIVVRARNLGAEKFKIVATGAARDASNSDALTGRIRQLTSLETGIISGVEEARFICKGALANLELNSDRVLMADIGGGSTELIFARRGEEPVLASVPVGAVYLTETFIHHDPPLPMELSAAFEDASSRLCEAYSCLPSGAEELVGLGGTITTIPPILMEMEKYDPSRVHNTVVTRDQVESVLLRLMTMSLWYRVEVKGLEVARADIIVGGLAIVTALLEVTGFQNIRVSDEGILLGLALSMVSPSDLEQAGGKKPATS